MNHTDADSRRHRMGGGRRRRCASCHSLVEAAVLDTHGRCESCQTQLDLFATEQEADR